MAILSRKPVVKDFKVKSLSDEASDVTVTIRQARTGDTIRRGELFADTSRVWDDAEVGKVELRQKWNVHEQRRFECMLTVVNVAGLEDEEGKAWFPSKETPDGPRLSMSEHSFNRAYDMLPDDATREIHRYVLEVNPQWNPDLSGE